MAFSEKELQSILGKLTEASESKGLNVDIKETFTMVITKHKEIPICRILINGKEIKEVKQFN